jgi:hypothetical protein
MFYFILFQPLLEVEAEDVAEEEVSVVDVSIF